MPQRTSPRPPRPELLALLRTCKLCPDDDFPRLVLADWLEEHGEQERAEFIRIRCELESEQARQKGSRYRWRKLVTRQNQIAHLHKRAWLGGLSQRPRFRHWHLPRGLIHLSLTGRVFLGQRIQQLDGAEEWAWVERLYLSEVARQQARRIAASLLLRELASFDLSSNCLGDQGVEAIAASRFLSHLNQLELRGVGISDTGAKILAESDSCDNLHYLDLRHNRTIGPAGVEKLRNRFGPRVLL